MIDKTIGLIGLGLLGSALAQRLNGHGWSVIGYDINPDCRQRLADRGGQTAAAPNEVAQRCGRILLSLPTSQIVASVIGEMQPALRPGTILLDTTTGDPEETAGLGRRLADGRIHYLETCVVGSSVQAGQGDVVVLAGGERVDFENQADLLSCFAKQTFFVGSWGAGMRMKLAVNLVLGLNRAVLAEGLALATRNGLDPLLTLEVFRSGAAYSRVMDTKGMKMIERDFQPQARLSQHLKDVRLILADAARCGAKAPFSQLHAELLQQLQDAGRGEEDNSAIVACFD